MELRRSTIKEEITFMPFDTEAFKELKDWITNDDLSALQSTFGPNVNSFEDINIPFMKTLADKELPDSYNLTSMIAAVRTSYHRLIHIGYV